MLDRKFIYDFGISQDDPYTELNALDLKQDDRILCIASAGEIPLELLANSPASVMIDAVDISLEQLFLTNLKLQAAIHLEEQEAARFLGYVPAGRQDRIKWFDGLKEALPFEEVEFWKRHRTMFTHGAVSLGRYEYYMARFAPIGRFLLGGSRRIRELFNCNSIEEQKEYFEQKLRQELLKKLFLIMFHPRIYKNRGIAQQGLIHAGKVNMGAVFFSKFRDFCTNTPARENLLLQFALFQRALFSEALPRYLANSHKNSKLEQEQYRLTLKHISFTNSLMLAEKGRYNKFALSNISDWLSQDEFTEILSLIADKSRANGRGLYRYLYSPGRMPGETGLKICPDPKNGEELLTSDRFPFYSLVPFILVGESVGLKTE